MEGAVDEDWVMQMAVRLVEAGAGSVGLSDTAGWANPVQVKRMFPRLRHEIGDHAGAAHFHNTYGQGLANVVAALEAGVNTFDASQGGLGGCPYAPGATGNIVTEDLVFLLESMGLRTGIDLDRLIAARAIIAEGLPGEPLYGNVAGGRTAQGLRLCDCGGRCGVAPRSHRPHGAGLAGLGNRGAVLSDGILPAGFSRGDDVGVDARFPTWARRIWATCRRFTSTSTWPCRCPWEC